MSKGKLIRGIAEEAGEALTKAAPKVRKTLGDIWGFKGGKRNEITGTEFSRRWGNIETNAEDALVKGEGISSDELFAPTSPYYVLYDDMVMEGRNNLMFDSMKQFERSSDDFRDFLAGTYGIDVDDVMKRYEYFNDLTPTQMESIDKLMGDFYSLEKAGVPREFTGRIIRLGKMPPGGADILKKVPLDEFNTWYSMVSSGVPYETAQRVVSELDGKSLDIAKGILANGSYAGDADMFIRTVQTLAKGT